MIKFFSTLIVFFTVCGCLKAQPIYRGLIFGMSAKDAKLEFKTNKDQYEAVDFGNGFVWRVFSQNFIFSNDSLVVVLMSPKGALMGLTSDGVTSYLEFSKAFFIDKGYQVFFEPEFWQYPLNFSSIYGLLLYNPDKTVMVQLYPAVSRISGNTYFHAYMKIINYNWFMRDYQKRQMDLKQKSYNSGF